MPPTTTTTPILGSPRAPSTPSPAGAIKDAVLPTSTGAHTPRRNGRTQDVSHLLGFTLTPRVPPPAATPRRSARKATSSWFDKQRFVHQYRFVVKPDKLYLSQLADPDLYHAWEDVLQVIVPTSSALSTASTSTIDQPVGRDQEGGAVPTCPICLSEPTAARMSKCGHVYCYPCLLHYLALADGTKWRKCPVCYDSIYAKDLKSVKWHDPLAATAFSSLSLLPTDLYSHPTSFYTDAHLPTEPLKMRLIRRPQLSTLALPRSSTWPSEAVPPLRAPWQFTPDAMAFAKFMLGAPDYMKAELEGDLKELEAEVATLQRWGMKGGTDEEIGVVFVKAAMEKVKEQLEKVVEMKTHSVMTARKQALRELQAVEDAVGKHLLAPELPLFSETSSSEVEEDVPTEFLASRSPGGGSIGALSSSAAPFTPGGTTGLPTPPTTINKARPQRKNVNPPTSDADVTYLFYQAASGQNIFLQPLDIRILKSHFGSYEALPDTIEVLVEGSDEGSMNEELRRRCRWISHLPTSADVVFIEADLSRLVSKDVLEPFNVALKQRRTKRRDKSRREDKAKLKSEEKEVNDRPYYDLLQGSGGHSSYQFSSIPSAFSLATSSAHAFPPPSNDPTPTVRTPVYVDQSSASESTRTVWGTRSIASSQPIYEPEETEYDERWADFEDNIAVGYGNGTRRRGVGAGGGSTGSNSQGTRDRDRDVVGMPAGHAQGKGKKKKKIVLSLTGAGGRGTAYRLPYVHRPARASVASLPVALEEFIHKSPQLAFVLIRRPTDERLPAARLRTAEEPPERRAPYQPVSPAPQLEGRGTDPLPLLAVLSRLKRRDPSSSGGPTLTSSPSASGSSHSDAGLGLVASPSPSRKGRPTSTSLVVDENSRPPRSPSRDSSMSASIGDRRSVSYNLPYLAVGGPGATAGGGMGRTGTMGEGSLSLDDMAGANGGVTLLVQAPELMVHDGEGGGHDSFRTPPADLISRPLELGPSAPLPNKLSAVRPRAATTSEGSSSARPSGLSALAGINSSSLPSFSDALAAPTPFPGPLPGIGSRPVSRSGSINSQQAPENLVPHPPTTASASSSRKGTLVGPESQTPGRSSSKAPRSASGSVASAMLLSGMSLVSSSGSSRQGAVLGRSSTAPIAGRDSLDDSDGVSSFGERGLMSMESLGEFDDGVSQMGTGYAVASSKRNAEFHAIFKSITDDDYLIEDYGCALQREILIQGRLYISEHHLSFNANIFGWVTTVTLPFAEIVSIEKRMTAYVIPNAIQVTTLHSRYIIASFLSRDTTYDLLVNIWRMVHPAVPISVAQPDSSSQPMDDDGGSLDSFDENDAGRSANIGSIRGRSGTRAMRRVGEGGRKGDPRRPSITSPRGSSANLKLHPVTVDTCPTLKHLTHVCMDTVFPSAPEKIYNLMFTSGFMREFFINDQRLMDLQISDWAPETSGSNLLARTMSFIKPLSAPIGPKQTKCLLRDENAHVDFDNYVCVITTTRTPDVPSGSAFAVKTRTSMTWAKNNSCRVVVLTGVEWTKSSFLKGIIERSCLEGQKTHHVDLEKAMRSYIHQHRSEFLEEGQEVDNTSSIDTSSLDDEDAVGTGEGFTEMVSVASDDRRAFGAVQAALPFLQPVFATMSGVGDLLGGVSIVNTSVAFFVVVLVLSNLWTLSRRPTSVDPRSYDPSQQPSNRRTPDEVANAVRDVLHDYFTLQSPPTTPSLSSDMIPTSPAQEAADIGAVLDTLEARIAELRRGLASLD